MRQLSLKYRIALTIFVLEALLMSLVLWQTLSHQVESTAKQLEATEEVTLDLLSGLSRIALLTNEFAVLQPSIEEVLNDPRVLTIVLTDDMNRVVASSSPFYVGEVMDGFKSKGDGRWRVREISNVAGTYGRLAIEFSNSRLMEATAEARNLGISLAVIGMFLIAVVGIVMGFVLTRRLENLTHATTKFADGDFTVRTGETGTDEVARLGKAFDEMAEEIQFDIAQLQDNEERFALAVRATHDGIWDWHVNSGSIYFSPRCAEMLGYEESQTWAKFSDWRDHIHPDDLGRVLEVWAGYMEGNISIYSIDYRLRTRLGHYIWVRSKGLATRDEIGNVVRITGSLTDITEQSLQAAALEHQALHDSLTGLPNRTLFYDRLRQAILIANREKAGLAVLMMDLDRFKDINDTLGHHVGDSLLKRVGGRLHQVLRESDTVARLGGDEFAVLIPDADMSIGVSVARKIVSTLEEPIQLERHQLEINGSIGISLYPFHGDNAELLMQRADVAMYVAKQSGSGHAVYDVKQDQHSVNRLNLVSELRHAINFEQLILHYQPFIDLKNGKVTGVEALVRWRHPKLGLIPPDEFVPLAEQTGLIRPLTRWVLNAALCQMSAWRSSGIDLQVAVNLSARNLHEHNLIADINNMVTIWGVPMNRLTLEITESAIMAHSERAMEILSTLNGYGVRLSIDDFGTGYSSLANLKAMPVHALKVDKSFVSDMDVDENDAVIVRSIIDLAHNLGLKVTAEGVEKEETWALLQILRCDEVQGQYLCDAQPPAEFVKWLERYEPVVGSAAQITLREAKT